MKKIDFNENWSYRRLGTDEEFKTISLPYDCMLHEQRSDDSPGGCNNAWFEGYDYEFVKEFERSSAEIGKTVFAEFEGIYHQGEIFINGEKVGYRPNGYLGITADITKFLKEGKNVIRVTAVGKDVPNSRWYTGVGIYRPVYLYEADEKYVTLDGVKIKTLSIDPAVVEVDITSCGSGEAEVALLFDGKEVVKENVFLDGHGSIRFTVPDAKLWSVDSPNLYKCRIRFGSDERKEPFGIRKISCDAKKGFCINDKRVIMYGACLHHDNGLIGSVSIKEAEERKVRLLRSAGFNAIRSAHNPCSKELLDACDKFGVLVMDEYADSWYIRKTKYDYALHLREWYERDLKDMADKDFNHPCVVLYSLGNEVSETAEKEGVELFIKMRDTLKSYDDTRPVTCGINIGFNQAAASGHSFFSDARAEENDFKNLGTEKANHVKWMFGPLFTKLNAVLPGCDKATREIFAASDVAGYNYGILRYKHDRRKYPDRIILGSESFCEDAERFYKIVHRDNGIIGDFVWTGMDHIGEVGLGSWEYRDYAPTYIHTKGWLTSGSGRIDITGKLLPEAYYMKAAFGLLKNPVIAVRPPNHNGERHSPSGWKFTNSVCSWAWEGCEGKKAVTEVYGCGEYVELYLNGKKIGRKKLGKRCRAIFNITYRKGVLTAIVYDKNNDETGRVNLESASGDTKLAIEPENNTVKSEGLCYIRLRLTDEAGTTKVLERKRIKVTVDGGELLGLGHACPYNEDGYVSDETSTYFGEALAVVKADGSGKLSVRASFDGGEARTEIIVI